MGAKSQFEFLIRFHWSLSPKGDQISIVRSCLGKYRLISKVGNGMARKGLGLMWGSSSSSFQQTHCIVVCPVDRRSPVLDDDKSYCFSPKKRGEETHSVQQKPQKSYVPWNECTTGRLLWHQRDHLLMDKGGNWFLGRRRRPARRPQMSSRTQVHHYSLCHSTLWSVKSKLHFLFSSFKLSIFF